MLPSTPTKQTETRDDKIVAYHEEYSGLIPHPRLMREWNDIVPGSATKIFERFEKQSNHRMDTERKVVRANNFKQYAGIIFAFIIAMTAISGGIFTALKGLPFLGGSLSFAGLGMLVGAFLVNTFHNPNKAGERVSKMNKTAP
ncbi:MAG: DUF2335 domain-containing protein [Candidatus Sungiibacteriota bacterium]